MTDEDIQRILHRAAELQSHRTTTEPALPAATNDKQRLEFLAQAAAEVGISRHDFALATAELTGSPTFKAIPEQKALKARKWLANQERVFELDVAIPFPADQVLAAFQTVLTGSDFQVEVANMVGDDPLVDGILVLEPAAWNYVTMAQLTKFRYAMITADFRQLLVAVRTPENAPGTTQLSFHTALDHSAVVNYGWGQGSQITLALLGGLAGLALGALAGPVVSVVAALAAGTATAIGVKAGWRLMYAWGLEKGRQAVRELATRVERTLKMKRG